MQVTILLMIGATFHHVELLWLVGLLHCKLLFVHVLQQIGLHQRLFAQELPLVLRSLPLVRLSHVCVYVIHTLDGGLLLLLQFDIV